MSTIEEQPTKSITEEQPNQPITEEQPNQPITEEQPNQPITEQQNQPITEQQNQPITEEQPNQPITEEQEQPIQEQQNQLTTEQPMQEQPITEQPMQEQQNQPITEQPIQEQQTQPITEQPIQEEPITEQQTKEPEETKTENTINIPVSKENLDRSAVAVNANVLANLVLYQSILEKIKEVSDPSEKSDIESKIEIVNNLIKTSKELLQLVQISLNIPEDQQIDEDTIISKSKGDINNKFKIFNVAESLGFLGLGLALLGGKNKQKKYTKRASNKLNKNKKKNTRAKKSNTKTKTKTKTNK